MILLGSEVTDIEDNKGASVSLKISPEDHEWFDDEQRRIKKNEGEKPTQPELFHRLRQAYVIAREGQNPIQESKIVSPSALESSTISANPNLVSLYESAVRLLRSAIQDEDEDTLKTLQGYLEFLEDRRKKRGKGGSGKGGRAAKKA